MPVDPHIQRFLQMLAATYPADPSRLTIQQRRDGFRDLMRLSGNAPTIDGAEDRSVPGPDGPIGIRVYTPAGMRSRRLPGLIYFHGGGLVAGSLDTHDTICRILANEIGCRLVSVDYRLAPEHKFPAAVTDSHAATTWIIDNATDLEIDADRIAVGGDSAGGTLAAVVCQMLHRSHGAKLAYQLLLCPIMDNSQGTETRQAFAHDRLIGKAMMDHDLDLYLAPGQSPAHPWISPLRADDLSGLPPALIHTAEFDPLCDEGRLYAEKLTAAGVEVSHTCHPGMIHSFYALARIVPYASIAMKIICAEVGRAIPPVR